MEVVSFSLLYEKPLIIKPGLSRKLSEIRAYGERLPKLDRELGFWQHLEKARPPYLDAMFVAANAAPPGTRIDSLSMTRRGDVALRTTMRDPQQAVDFRSKLIDSGLFSSVVVDEQTPTPDRQKILVRMSAQWKPANSRPALPAAVSQTQNVQNQKPAADQKSSVSVKK